MSANKKLNNYVRISRIRDFAIVTAIVSLSVFLFWFFTKDTELIWDYVGEETGQVVGYRTSGKSPLIYAIVELDTSERVLVKIETKTQIETGDIVVLYKYAHPKKASSKRFRYGIKDESNPIDRAP